MSDTLRRGACPALSAPMLTGDGWLLRIALSDAITPAKLAAIATLGSGHGNGIIDISARGNLQLRGLTPDSALALEADIRALDLPLREGLAVETGPLAGIDPHEMADPRPLAEAIREKAQTDNITPRLAAKMTVIIDGGGQIPLDDLLADIRLNARDETTWALSIGGTAKTARMIGLVKTQQATQAVLDILHHLAGKGPATRGRDFSSDDIKARLQPFLLDESPAVTPPAITSSSLITLADGLHATRIAPAFGQCTAGDISALCEQATLDGVQRIRPAPDHALLLIGTAQACTDMLEWAASHDFITSSADPRASIAACPGKPSCGSAGIATRPLASDIASQCGRLFDGSFTLHISGCAKGCAHPEASLLTLSSTSENVLNIIANGRAGDAPVIRLGAGEAIAAFRRLADLVKISRKSAETSAECIARLGPAGLKTAFIQEYP